MSALQNIPCPCCGEVHDSTACHSTDSGAHCAESLGSDLLMRTVPASEIERLNEIERLATVLVDAVTARMSAESAEEKLVWNIYQAHRALSDALFGPNK